MPSVPIGRIQVEAVTDAEAAAADAQSSELEAETAATIATDSAVSAQESAQDARDSKTAAGASAEASEGYATAALNARDAAANSESLATSSKTAAQTAATAAGQAKTASEAARDVSVSAKDVAVSSASSAVTARGEAITSAAAAQTAFEQAEAARVSAVTAKNDAVTAKDATLSARVGIADALTSAQTQATRADARATDANNAYVSALSAKAAAEAAQAAAIAEATKAQGHATTANAQRVLAETARTAAETARGAAETARTASEGARDIAVTARGGAETARDQASAAATNAINTHVAAADPHAQYVLESGLPTLRTNMARNPTGASLTSWGLVNGGAGAALAVSNVIFPESGEPGIRYTYGSTTTRDSGPAQVPVDVVAGRTYTASLYFYKDVPLAGGLALRAYGPQTAPGAPGGALDDGVGSFRRVSVTFTAQASGQVTIFLGKSTLTDLGGAVVHVGDLLVEEGTRVLPYFGATGSGARWAGAVRASSSELVSPRVTDLASLAQTAVGRLEGNGAPAGVVSAPVGWRYIDTAATNGAIEWISTAPGVGGWSVTHGDTGWRNVLGLLGNGWTASTFLLRRSNYMVEWRFTGLSAASATAGSILAAAIPSGFASWSGVSDANLPVVSTTNNAVRRLVLGGSLGIFGWVAADSYTGSASALLLPGANWPPTLPGIKA